MISTGDVTRDGRTSEHEHIYNVERTSQTLRVTVRREI